MTVKHCNYIVCKADQGGKCRNEKKIVEREEEEEEEEEMMMRPQCLTACRDG